MELLIVIAIIIALFAILIPVVNTRYQQWQRQQVQISLTNIAAALETFRAEYGRYPTTEEGLRALVYIPVTTGQVQLPGQPQMPGQIPGQMPTMPGVTIDPNTGESMPNPMDGGSMGIGPVTQQGGTQGMGMGMGMTEMGMGMSGGTFDPSTGEFVANPMEGGSGVVGPGMSTVWTLPTGNDQLYPNPQQQKRPAPPIREKDLLDPWKRPFRYDSSLMYPQDGIGGLNANGQDRPAIWSAGPDGIDGTPDDILNWLTEEANEAIMLQQQSNQMRGNVIGPMNDPSNPFGNDPQFNMGMPQYDPDMGMPMNPNQGFGPMQPGMPQPGMPQPGMPQF